MFRLRFLVLGILVVSSCAAPAATPVPTASPVPATMVSTAATTVPPTVTSAPATTVPPTAASAAAAIVPPTATRVPATTVPPTAVSKAPTTLTGGATGKFNVDEFLPPGPGRELLLQYCLNCHNFVPITLTRKTKEEWISHRMSHENKLKITDAEMTAIWNYMIIAFPVDKPLPKIPPEFLEDWTSY